MGDDGGVDRNIEEVCDAPDSVWDYRFEPAREDKNDEAVEREDAEGERERIEFIGPEGDEGIGKSGLDIGVKEEASAVKKCKEKCLESEYVVNGKGIDGFQDFVQNRKANGDTQEDNDPRKSKGDESRSAREVPDPWGFSRDGVGGNGGCCRGRGIVERVPCGENFGAVVPAVTVAVGIFRIGFEEGCLSDIGESIEVGINGEIVRVNELRFDTFRA